ncbi:homeobox domain-containing protein [Cercophora scortea]|uniref:Homeobox domain-containing protein n=1 Tax=Cercophora scortea TaxID=314031 RepID=A0AAE0MIA4_9PEZI|nr:homeobox domain-containing protein [Cercophora scortea]
MSMIAMAQPVPHSAFKREFAWDESRRPDYTLSRPRGDNERIALPPIRQTFPELSVQITLPNRNARTITAAASPVGGLGGGVMTSPDYVHSPNQNKRRRLSFGEEREERVSQVPRLYASPQREVQMPRSRGLSPTLSSRSVTESWASPPRTSPYTQAGSLPPMREPAPMEISERLEPRLPPPRLPSFSFDRGSATMPRIRGHSTDENYPGNLRHVMAHSGGSAMETRGPHLPPSPYYAYHHPSRVQSLSLGSIHPFDRAPFSPGGYGSPYQDYMRVGELGGMGMSMGMRMGGSESKQRKRRGNLPKETTDKLRAWFMGHLHHPYPTEDEKQDLMRQTGLAMNQISNWFINARRRQLPAMINNARAESDATSARSAGGKLLSSTERAEYQIDKAKRRRGSRPLSDGEGSPFDEDDGLENLKRRHTTNMSRGSI